MSLSEFDIISRYFNQPGLAAAEGNSAIAFGIGDDCALIDIPSGKQLAVSMDMLVEDIHFPGNADGGDIASRALAVNLSDLAAMGAAPVGFTLGLAMPERSPRWLEAFADGLRQEAQQFSCPLIGGDITRSEKLSISIQVHGLCDTGKGLLRSGACVEDLVMVSGALGGAGLALRVLQDRQLENRLSPAQRQVLHEAFYAPEPQLVLGQYLAGQASACIDVSDGLMADLGHIAGASRVGMTVRLADIPVPAVAQELMGLKDAQRFALGCGDDYQLAFTLAGDRLPALQAFAIKAGIPLQCIGHVTAEKTLQCLDDDGKPVPVDSPGYRHF